MGQRGFKQLTARDRVLIAKLKVKKLAFARSPVGSARTSRRFPANCGGTRRERRRRTSTSGSASGNCGQRTRLDEYLEQRPAEERKVKTHWMHAEAQWYCDRRRWLANQKRRRKQPGTRKWVIEKLREGWSPQQIAGPSKLEGSESVSHEYVYALLYRDKKRGGRLYRRSWMSGRVSATTRGT
jgi:hypothetical protein